MARTTGWRQVRAAITSVVVLTIVCGVVFPAVMLGIARFVFPDAAGGSLVHRGERIVGSSLIGQPFAAPGFFHPRPSAAGAGYDGASSSGTNLAQGHPKLVAQIGEAARRYRDVNGLPDDTPIPADAVTSSGSGLDPHISPENARLQVRRVALQRGLSEAAVADLVERATTGRTLFVLGEPRVDVLALNRALDAVAPRRMK